MEAQKLILSIRRRFEKSLFELLKVNGWSVGGTWQQQPQTWQPRQDEQKWRHRWKEEEDGCDTGSSESFQNLLLTQVSKSSNSIGPYFWGFEESRGGQRIRKCGELKKKIFVLNRFFI